MAYAKDIIVTVCHYTGIPVLIYMAVMKNDYHRSQYRLPDALYERLKAAAESNGRSLNNEMVVRLEASFHPPLAEQLAALLDAQTEQLIKEIRKVGEA